MFLLSLALASPHKEHAELRLGQELRAAPTPPTEAAEFGEAHTWVYGYLPYWVDVEPEWSGLTHLAFFNVDLAADGSIEDSWRWDEVAPDLVPRAHEHGVKVHLTLTCFDDAVMEAVLPSPAKRARAIGELKELVDAYDADGVSVDCEGMPSSLKGDLVDFVAELSEAVDEVTVATPAIDWSGAYDYDALAAASDALFIMGYGYHWSGSDPGPVAPLYGGDPWSKYSLEWTVQDYLSNGAPPEKIILGLPLYGRIWPTTDSSVPGSATGSSDAVVMSTGMSWGLERYDAVTETPYSLPSEQEQLWLDDHDSVLTRIRWTVDQGLLGTGFWALGYEAAAPDFWYGVKEETRAPGPNPLVEANAGEDFMAYTGQTVELNGTGVGEGELSYAWVRVSGPPAELNDPNTQNPQFTPDQPGTYTFELAVSSDAGESSLPDAVSVVVVHTDAGTVNTGGRCTTGPGPSWALGALLGLLALRR